jgi:hypothetical protein
MGYLWYWNRITDLSEIREYVTPYPSNQYITDCFILLPKKISGKSSFSKQRGYNVLVLFIIIYYSLLLIYCHFSYLIKYFKTLLLFLSYIQSSWKIFISFKRALGLTNYEYCKHLFMNSHTSFAQSDSAETVVKPIAHSKMQSTYCGIKWTKKVLQTIRKTKLPFLNLMKIRKRELVLARN